MLTNLTHHKQKHKQLIQHDQHKILQINVTILIKNQ